MWAVSSNEGDHTKKAAHDAEVSNKLACNAEYCDWRVVCLFYSIIHGIHAYACRNNLTYELIPVGSDEQGKWYSKRERFVQKHLRKFLRVYNRLCGVAYRLRYDPTYYREIPSNKTFFETLINEGEEFRKSLTI
jgi:hypothetical protein